jgi:UPF0716 protein FxsA
VLVGGLLMMLPGFFTDVVGLLLLLPPVRHYGAQIVLARFARRLPPSVANDLIGPVRVKARRARGNAAAPPPTGRPDAPVQGPPPTGGKVIEGEIQP